MQRKDVSVLFGKIYRNTYYSWVRSVSIHV